MILRALVLLPLVAASPAAADCAASPAGDYVCAYGCRPTDANPRIEVDGGEARCWNELGGLFVGVAAAPRRGRLFPQDRNALLRRLDDPMERRRHLEAPLAIGPLNRL